MLLGQSRLPPGRHRNVSMQPDQPFSHGISSYSLRTASFAAVRRISLIGSPTLRGSPGSSSLTIQKYDVSIAERFSFSIPNFVGVIPDGQSFNITSTPTFLESGGGFTGFNWTVPVNAGTELILLSGDSSATGAGGSVDYNVQPPSNASNTACFSSMPSATSGTPAGGFPSGSATSASSQTWVASTS